MFSTGLPSPSTSAFFPGSSSPMPSRRSTVAEAVMLPHSVASTYGFFCSGLVQQCSCSPHAEEFVADMPTLVVVEINFCRLVRRTCRNFTLPPPRCGIIVDALGRFCYYVDIEIPRRGPMKEVVTCWGSVSTNTEQAREDAAHTAAGRLCDEQNFEANDLNYDERKFYEYLFKHFLDEHDDLRDKYEQLKCEHKCTVTQVRRIVFGRMETECVSTMSWPR